MWCELSQGNFFDEYQMEGVCMEQNEIFLELIPENLSRALKTAQNAKSVKVKLTNKHCPCLTVALELPSLSSSSRIVTHDIPVSVIPRRLWNDFKEPSVPEFDVSIYLPALKTMKSVVERMKNLSNYIVIEANRNGEINLKIETDLVSVSTHFKDLGNPPWVSDDASQNSTQEIDNMAEARIDIRKLLQFLAGQQVNPTKAICTFETLARNGLPQKRLISIIYNLLTTPPDDPPYKHKYMDKWDAVLPQPLTPEEWASIWDNARKMSMCVRQKEHIYKIMMFWYHTPDKLHKFFPTCPSTCWRNCGAQGTLLHIFWECPAIQQMWSHVADLISRIFSQQIPTDLPTFLLGKPFTKLCKSGQTLVNHILTAARLTIASNWKTTNQPTLAEIIKRTNTNRIFEHGIAVLQNKVAQYMKVWTIWGLRGLAS
ncbi:hypothetical protein XENTR_v10016367 [Xenopus tropicalis]|nr:hypothetical protein XENTR_v10016367 [Xenopus tropicalis]